MIYNLINERLLQSTDGSVANIVPEMSKYDQISNWFFLPEAGELYYEGTKYEVIEPSILFKTSAISYKGVDEKYPSSIFIVPCKDFINGICELRIKREEIRNKQREMRDGVNVEQDCVNCEAVS